jgi:isopentenyl-diphosphate delta-isomerase
MITEERVILVDSDDREVGTAEKLDAHRRGILHRAVSALVFDSAGRQLLQRRAGGKYHSSGLWSNACCSHPRPGESAAEAVARRLGEEMGITVPLLPLLHFTYRAELGDGMVEHEVDHVFIGAFEGSPEPDPAEVSEWRWIAADALDAELALAPEMFTRWFHLVVAEVQRRVP